MPEDEEEGEGKEEAGRISTQAKLPVPASTKDRKQQGHTAGRIVEESQM